MIKANFILLILIFNVSCNTKEEINKDSLRVELDSIYSIDQKHRKEIQEAQKVYGWNAPELFAIQEKIHKVDSSNLNRIIEIINMVGGYPGKSLVGESASKATFYVLQHAPDSIQDKYLELILGAATNNELDKRKAALYQDRYLMYKGEPQIYGSQVRFDSYINNDTGKKIDTSYVWPIADTTNIDSIRNDIGLKPLEEYLNQFELSRWNN